MHRGLVVRGRPAPHTTPCTHTHTTHTPTHHRPRRCARATADTAESASTSTAPGATPCPRRRCAWVGGWVGGWKGVVCVLVAWRGVARALAGMTAWRPPPPSPPPLRVQVFEMAEWALKHRMGTLMLQVLGCMGGGGGLVRGACGMMRRGWLAPSLVCSPTPTSTRPPTHTHINPSTNPHPLNHRSLGSWTPPSAWPTC